MACCVARPILGEWKHQPTLCKMASDGHRGCSTEDARKETGLSEVPALPWKCHPPRFSVCQTGHLKMETPASDWSGLERQAMLFFCYIWLNDFKKVQVWWWQEWYKCQQRHGKWMNAILQWFWTMRNESRRLGVLFWFPSTCYNDAKCY